jgi:hypothetical protein
MVGSEMIIQANGSATINSDVFATLLSRLSPKEDGMKPQQIGKIWAVVSLVLLYYALNSYLVIQGGQEIFGAKLVTDNRVPAAMIAVVICSALLGIASGFGIDFARSGGVRWADRIPLFAFEEIDSSKLNARIYQGFMLFVLSILPSASLIHFWRVFASAKVATTDSTPKLVESIWTWSAFSKWDNPADVCTTFDLTSGKCDGKMTLLPGLEPTLFAILTGLAVATTLVFWLLVAIPGAWPRRA